MPEPKLFGICGWKNSGKTTLTCNLVTELVSRGFRVATIKHAHHSFDIDHEGTDSYSHRAAGASEVIIASANRWAQIRETDGSKEPSLVELAQKLGPCDLVLVEGYKKEPIPKIETMRAEAMRDDPFWKSDGRVVAIASDTVIDGCPLPRFGQSEIVSIADFIIEHMQMEKPDAAQ